MKNAYIFDLGNTLVRFDPLFMAGVYSSDPDDTAEIARVMFDRLYWDKLDYAGITDCELKEAACARLPERLREKAILAYDHWQENLPDISGMREILCDLKTRGKRLILLSNISTGFEESWQSVPSLVSLFSLFDGLVFSGSLGMIKPSPEIFAFVLRKYLLDAADCLFIDDNPKNTASAASLGIESYLFDGDAAKLRKYIFEE